MRPKSFNSVSSPDDDESIETSMRRGVHFVARVKPSITVGDLSQCGVAIIFRVRTKPNPGVQILPSPGKADSLFSLLLCARVSNAFLEEQERAMSIGLSIMVVEGI